MSKEEKNMLEKICLGKKGIGIMDNQNVSAQQQHSKQYTQNGMFEMIQGRSTTT